MKTKEALEISFTPDEIDEHFDGWGWEWHRENITSVHFIRFGGCAYVYYRFTDGEEGDSFDSGLAWTEVVKTGEAITFEEKFTTPTGVTIYFKNLMSPVLDEDRKVSAVSIISSDITNEINLVTQAQEQKEELERSYHELEQFAYVASHDLKAPITNAVSLLEIIYKQDGVAEHAKETFKKVLQSMNHMKVTIRTLNEVMVLKKNLKQSKENVKLDEALQEVLKGIEHQLEESRAILSIDFSKCPTVEFPPVHLQSILQNLLTNAIKYRKKGTSLRITISSGKKRGCEFLQVKDNGRGIDLDEYGHKLFGLFQRFHLDEKDGRGIGLHMVKAIVDAYGGTIEVQSKVGVGTSFKIFF